MQQGLYGRRKKYGGEGFTRRSCILQRKILIADDQELLADSLKTILDLEDDFQVVGTARTGQEACDLIGRLRPDLVLMDIQMPVLDGIEALRRIKAEYPDTVVLMLTSFAEDHMIAEALSLGASGYLLKDMNADRLIAAIRQALEHQMILPAAVATRVARQLSLLVDTRNHRSEGRTPPADLADLSPREQGIARMLAEGYSNRQIAAMLEIAEGTVKNYISGVYAKIGISDRVQAGLYLRKIFPKPEA